MVEVRLVGRDTTFGAALAERLERVGIPINSTDGINITCWEGGEVADSELLIRPASSPKPRGNHSSTLVIHDLYIPTGSGCWGPAEIEERLNWLSSSEGAPSQGNSRHWIHVRDAVDAVAAMLEQLPSRRLDMCGRRSWSHEAMCEELDMLWSRFQAAVDHSFEVDHLEVSEPQTEPTERVDRPDLGPLHSSLEAAGTAGWHPLVPFRVGLMECIANRLDDA